MKLLQQIPTLLRNKFLIAAAAFLVWLLFFDRNDFFTQQERRRELRELQAGKKHFQEQIEKERRFAENLRNDPATIERFARERYLMKRENEDLFLVPEKEEAPKQ